MVLFFVTHPILAEIFKYLDAESYLKMLHAVLNTVSVRQDSLLAENIADSIQPWLLNFITSGQVKNHSSFEAMNEVTITQTRLYSEALSIAASEGNPDRIGKLLQSFGVDPKWQSSLALRNACRHNNKQAVKLLLDDKRANPGDSDSMALRWASEHGFTEIVQMLLHDKRARPDAVDSYSLRLAAQNGHTEIVKLLLADGRADPAANHGEALLSASLEGDAEIVALLLKSGRVEPNAEDLEVAAESGHVDVVQLYIQDGRLDDTATAGALQLAKKAHSDSSDVKNLSKQSVGSKLLCLSKQCWRRGRKGQSFD